MTTTTTSTPATVSLTPAQRAALALSTPAGQAKAAEQAGQKAAARGRYEGLIRATLPAGGKPHQRYNQAASMIRAAIAAAREAFDVMPSLLDGGVAVDAARDSLVAGSTMGGAVAVKAALASLDREAERVAALHSELPAPKGKCRCGSCEAKRAAAV